MNFKDKVLVVTGARWHGLPAREDMAKMAVPHGVRAAEIEVRDRCFENMCIRVSSSHLIPFYLMKSVKFSNNQNLGERQCPKEK
jgi:hypothetical protein